MKPAYAAAAAAVKSLVPGAYLAAVDATQASALGKRFQLQGFPTLKYFERGQFRFDYSGQRTQDALVAFVREPKEAAPAAAASEDDWSSHTGHEHVNMLTDQSFDEFVGAKSKVLVMFYAPCKSTLPSRKTSFNVVFCRIE